MVKPDGVTTDNVVCEVGPPETGWKAVAPVPDPPAIDTGEVVIVPIVVSELVTFTFTLLPPARACVDEKEPSAFSDTGRTLNDVSPAWVVVRKLLAPMPPGPTKINPDGLKLTVPEPVAYPVAEIE